MPASQTRIIRYRIGEAASGGMGPISQPPTQSESGPGSKCKELALSICEPCRHFRLALDSCSAAESHPQREEGAVTSASDPHYCLSACAFSAVNSASLRKVITATLRVR